MDEITIKELNIINSDYCIEINDDRLTDDIDEYIENEIECFEPKSVTSEYEIELFLERHESIPVYKKKYFKLPKGYLREHIEEYMYDNWYCEDPESYITDHESIDKFEEDFNNKQHGWYVMGEQVGILNLRKEINEALQEAYQECLPF